MIIEQETIEALWANPTDAPLPDNEGERLFLLGNLAQGVTVERVPALMQILERLPHYAAVMVVRIAYQRLGVNLSKQKPYIAWFTAHRADFGFE